MSAHRGIAGFAIATVFALPLVAVVPALAVSAPPPSLPGLATPPGVSPTTSVTTGVLIQARTRAGRSIPGALAFVYHAHAATDGWQRPVSIGITDAAGNVTIPLALPTTNVVGFSDGNYVAALFGLGLTAGENGVKYFSLTPTLPLPVVTIQNNLPPFPCWSGTGGPPSSIDPSQWGYHVTTDANEEGVLHVATAHGAGSWSGNSIDLGGLEQSPAEAIGEMATTEFSRTTLGTVGVRITLPGVPLPDGGGWNNDGMLKFGIDSSTDTSKLHDFNVEQAGLGAVAIIAPAKWAHSTEDFTCPGPNGPQHFQHEVISPLSWDLPRTPYKLTASASKDNFSAMINDEFGMSYPVDGGIDFSIGAGRGQAYGTDASLDVLPVLGYNFSSETHYDGATWVHFYSGNGCGQPGFEKCYYYTDSPTKTDCPDDLLCGSDFYTAVVPPTAPPPSVPGPAPRPCMPNSARNLCD